MSKLILIAPAAAVLCLAGCNYNENYNNAAEYNAGEANYSGSESNYSNATEYNATNANETYNEAANMAGNAANTAANSVTNNGY